MAVVNVKEGWSGKNFGKSRDGRSAARFYTILLDAATDDLKVVLEASAGGVAIPKYGQGHPTDDWLRVDSVQSNPRGPLLYDVIVQYLRRQRGGAGGDPDAATPFDEAWQIEWGWEMSTVALDQDQQDPTIPITNTADEPFDPPITRDQADLVLAITRNEPTYNVAQALAYRNVLNEDTFYGAPPLHVLCRPIEGRRVIEGTGIEYYRNTYRLVFREDTWNVNVLNQGYREKTGTDAAGRATYRQILDEDGNPLSEPVLLGITGERLLETQTPEWLSFARNKIQPFATLGLE